MDDGAYVRLVNTHPCGCEAEEKKLMPQRCEAKDGWIRFISGDRFLTEGYSRNHDFALILLELALSLALVFGSYICMVDADAAMERAASSVKEFYHLG